MRTRTAALGCRPGCVRAHGEDSVGVLAVRPAATPPASGHRMRPAARWSTSSSRVCRQSGQASPYPPTPAAPLPGPGCPDVAEGDVPAAEGTRRNRRQVRSPHTSAQRPRSIHLFSSTAIAVPLAGMPAWRWLPRPTSLAKTLAGEAAQRRRHLNFQQPTALTSRSKRGDREGSRGDCPGRPGRGYRHAMRIGVPVSVPPAGLC
jgi:hypothetical protein